MNLSSALKALEAHPSLADIDVNKLSQYSRLIGCLRNDIMLAQPVDQVTEPPEILPPIIVRFLAEALQISDIQASWDILKEQLWFGLNVALEDEEYRLYKQFGWEKGLSEHMPIVMKIQ